MASIPTHPVQVSVRHLFTEASRTGITVRPAGPDAQSAFHNWLPLPTDRLRADYSLTSAGRPKGRPVARSLAGFPAPNTTSLSRRFPEAFIADAGHALIQVDVALLEVATLALLSGDDGLRTLLAAPDPWTWLTDLVGDVSRGDVKVAFFSWLWMGRLAESKLAEHPDPAVLEGTLQSIIARFGRAHAWLEAYAADQPEAYRSTARRERHQRLMQADGVIWQGLLGRVAARRDPATRPVLLTADTVVLEAPVETVDEVARGIRAAVRSFLAVELPDLPVRVDVATGPNLRDLISLA